MDIKGFCLLARSLADTNSAPTSPPCTKKRYIRSHQGTGSYSFENVGFFRCMVALIALGTSCVCRADAFHDWVYSRPGLWVSTKHLQTRRRGAKHTFLYAPPDAVIDECLCALHGDGALASQRDAEPHCCLQRLLFAPVHSTHESNSQRLLGTEEARSHGHILDPRQRADDLREP